MFYFILYFDVLLGLYFQFLLKLFILMTCFNCFELVGRLVRIPYLCCQNFKRQYFWGNMTWLHVSLFKKFFQIQTTSHKESKKAL